MKRNILQLSSAVVLAYASYYYYSHTNIVQATELSPIEKFSTVDNFQEELLSVDNHKTQALPTIDDISHTTVTVNSELNIPYEGKDSEAFDNHFVPGYGSAIAYKGSDEFGNPQFYALTDRGPNADGPTIMQGGDEASAKFFPTPEFTPSIGILTLHDAQATIDHAIAIQQSDQPISGLPMSNGHVGATNEVALTPDFNMLSYDDHGQDPEGIAIDAENNLWIADEYGPFLTKLDSNGHILKKYAPGDGLPEILKHRVPNRGFEGLTITPSGTLLAEVQSPLDIDGDTAKTALFTRILAFNPTSETTKMYAYPIDIDSYKHSKKAKIGDIYAIDDQHVLIIEQGGTVENGNHHKVYLVDLTHATDITNIMVDGKPLEYLTDITELPSDVHFATKQLLIDLDEAGWTADKAEGITMLSDKHTIAIINDNDFGLGIEAINIANGKRMDIEDLFYNPQSGEWFDDDENPITINIHLTPNHTASEIWLFHLDRPLVFETESTTTDSEMTATTNSSETTVIDTKPEKLMTAPQQQETHGTIVSEVKQQPLVPTHANTRSSQSQKGEQKFYHTKLPQTNATMTSPLLGLAITSIGSAFAFRKRRTYKF